MEAVCVNAFADGIGTDVPVIVSDGNHDSDETSDQERARGWTVLDGETVEVAGIRFLGDSDPTLTSMGAPTHPTRDETVPEMSERMAELVCEEREDEDPVDILMVHQPRAAMDSLRSGCVPLALSGHYHRRIGPWQRGMALQYMSASTAGATHDTPTVGSLQNRATITVMRWDRANHEPMDFRTIYMEPDQSVQLSPWQEFPSPPTERVELEWPEGDADPWS